MDERHRLTEEGRSLCRALTGIDASDQTLAHYVAAHESRRDQLTSTEVIDCYLVRLALRGRFAFRLADGWSGFFHRSGLLRRKLVLLTALLECEHDSWKKIDRARSSGFVGFCLRAGLNVALDVLAAVAATPLVAARVWPSRRREES